jgi:tRNA(fMet)-specific endonuclease VapC
MQFVLDTDHISLYQRQHPLVCYRINGTPTAQLAVTIISFEEQVAGRFMQIQRARNLIELVSAYQLLQGALDYFIKQQVLPFDETAALYFQQLQQQRLRVGTQDLRIAAIALANRCTIVTRNRRDFERVPGLLVEDWSVAATE